MNLKSEYFVISKDVCYQSNAPKREQETLEGVRGGHELHMCYAGA